MSSGVVKWMVEGGFGDKMGDAEVNIPLLKPLKPGSESGCNCGVSRTLNYPQ